MSAPPPSNQWRGRRVVTSCLKRYTRRFSLESTLALYRLPIPVLLKLLFVRDMARRVSVSEMTPEEVRPARRLVVFTNRSNQTSANVIVLPPMLVNKSFEQTCKLFPAPDRVVRLTPFSEKGHGSKSTEPGAVCTTRGTCE